MRARRKWLIWPSDNNNIHLMWDVFEWAELLNRREGISYMIMIVANVGIGKKAMVFWK